MTNTQTTGPLVFMTSCPALKGKARQFGASYRRLALVELEPGFEGLPAMISERARGVRKVHLDYVLSVGSTPRSEGYRVAQWLEACEAAQEILPRP